MCSFPFMYHPIGKGMLRILLLLTIILIFCQQDYFLSSSERSHTDLIRFKLSCVSLFSTFAISRCRNFYVQVLLLVFDNWYLNVFLYLWCSCFLWITWSGLVNIGLYKVIVSKIFQHLRLAPGGRVVRCVPINYFSYCALWGISWAKHFITSLSISLIDRPFKKISYTQTVI